MARPRKNKSAAELQRIALHRRIALGSVLTLLLVGAGGFAFWRLHQFVDQRVTFPAEPARVVLKNRPAWMSDFLADQIAAALRPCGTQSVFDQQLLVDVQQALTHDPAVAPWVLKVQRVRRVYGEAPGDTVEVECVWRTPAALVRWADQYWLVDDQGVRLPEQYNTEQATRLYHDHDGQFALRLIDGVTRPPPEPGRLWVGEDLSAALDLVRVLDDKPYARDIVAVNAANFAGRRDPAAAQLVLITRDGTEIRWGRPVNARDRFAEVSTAQKLRYLQEIVLRYHRVDAGHSAVDIRFDQVTFPNDEDHQPRADLRR